MRCQPSSRRARESSRSSVVGGFSLRNSCGQPSGQLGIEVGQRAGRLGAGGLEVTGLADAGGDLDERGHVSWFVELGQLVALCGKSRCGIARRLTGVLLVGVECGAGGGQPGDAFLLVDGECRSAVVVERTVSRQFRAELFQLASECGCLHFEAGQVLLVLVVATG